MHHDDFVLLPKAAADDYIARQPVWKRDNLKAAWRAGEDARAEAASRPTEDVVVQRPQPAKARTPRHTVKAGLGLVLIVLGVIVAFAGLVVDPTVETYRPAQNFGYGVVLPPMPESVVNLGKMTEKLMLSFGGIGLILMGMILRATAVVLTTLNERLG